MTVSGVLKNLARLSWVLFACIPLLVIYELNLVLVNKVAGMAGLRPDSPVILATRDRCDQATLFVPFLLHSEREDASDWSRSQSDDDDYCRTRIDILVSGSDDNLSLYVNRIQQADRSYREPGRNSTFSYVSLGPGQNVLSTRWADEFMWNPYGTNYAPADLSTFRTIEFDTAVKQALEDVWSRGTPSMERRNLSREFEVVVEGPGLIWKALPVGSWKGGEKFHELYLVYAGAVSEFDEAEENATREITNIQYARNGLLLRSMDVRSDASVPEGFPKLTRQLKLSRDDDGLVALDAKACLPFGHYLVERQESLALSSSEFLWLVFDTHVGVWGEPAELSPRLRSYRESKVGVQQFGKCVEFSTRFTIQNPDVIVRALEATSFPNLMHDHLLLSGFEGLIESSGRPAATTEHGVREWTGVESFEGTQLDIWLQPALDEAGRVQPQGDFDRGQDAPQKMRFSPLAELRESFRPPDWAGRLYYSLAPIVPVILLLWIMRRDLPEGFPIKLRRRLITGLGALIVFAMAFALQSVLSQLALFSLSCIFYLIASLQTVEVIRFQFPRSDLESSYIAYAAPLALISAALLTPLLRGNLSDTLKFDLTKLLHFAIAALSATVLCTAGLVSLLVLNLMMPSADGHFSPDFLNVVESLNAGSAAVVRERLFFAFLCGWLVLSACLFWVPVWLTVKSVFRLKNVRIISYAVAALLFVIPLVGLIVDIIAQTFSLLSFVRAEDQSPWNNDLAGGYAFWGGVVTQLPPLTSSLILFALVFLILIAFRNALAGLLPEEDGAQILKNVKIWMLIAVAFAFLIPSGSARSADFENSSALIDLFFAIFLEYAPILALASVFGLYRWLESQTSSIAGSRFELPTVAYTVSAAAFVGYLSIWDRNPISVVILMAISWFVFMRLILAAETHVRKDPKRNFAKEFLDYKSRCSLLDRVAKGSETRLIEGKISHKEHADDLAAIDKERTLSNTMLGVTSAEAKRDALGFGPKDSPMGNALLGAGFGLIAAVVIQVLAPLVSGNDSNTETVWFLLDILLKTPEYPQFTNYEQAPFLLGVFTRLLHSISFLVILGFIFGYVFHRVRGDDGFSKALVFSGGIAITYLASRALLVLDATNPQQVLERLVPVTFFLLLLGTLVFDRLSLEKQGVGIVSLRDIYGLPALLGYASLIGTLAGLRPLLNLLGLGG